MPRGDCLLWSTLGVGTQFESSQLGKRLQGRESSTRADQCAKNMISAAGDAVRSSRRQRERPESRFVSTTMYWPGSRLRFTKRVAETIRRSSIELYESTCDPEAILSRKR